MSSSRTAPTGRTASTPEPTTPPTSPPRACWPRSRAPAVPARCSPPGWRPPPRSSSPCCRAITCWSPGCCTGACASGWPSSRSPGGRVAGAAGRRGRRRAGGVGVHAGGTHTGGGLVGSAVLWKASATHEATSSALARTAGYQNRWRLAGTPAGDNVTPLGRTCATDWTSPRHFIPSAATTTPVGVSGSRRSSPCQTRPPAADRQPRWAATYGNLCPQQGVDDLAGQGTTTRSPRAHRGLPVAERRGGRKVHLPSPIPPAAAQQLPQGPGEGVTREPVNPAVADRRSLQEGDELHRRDGFVEFAQELAPRPARPPRQELPGRQLPISQPPVQEPLRIRMPTPAPPAPHLITLPASARSSWESATATSCSLPKVASNIDRRWSHQRVAAAADAESPGRDEDRK